MLCPKCDQGKIKKIQFKDNKEIAFLCEVCGALWLKGEDISKLSGRNIRSYVQDEDKEYSIDLIDEKDQEDEPLVPVKYK